MAAYSVIEVRSRKDLKRFISFPDKLYRDCPQYVPALHSDQVKSLTRVSTLSYCCRKMWLAEDASGEVAGRICGMVNPRYNVRYGTRRARFGWFDTVNDLEVARLLLGAAEDWAGNLGMDEIHGPLYYNTLGKQGMLVEGFENIPPFNCIYNYPYYKDLVEALGFVKECDWVQYDVKADQPVPDKARRVCDLVMERYNLHFGSLDSLKKDKAKVQEFFKVYNDSFSENVYNFVPFTPEEIEEEAAQSIPFISDKASCILLDENDSLVAFGISFPTISKALQKARGRMFPFGWIHFLKAMRDYETTDLMINGAVPEWQNRGVSAVYYKRMTEKAAAIGNHHAITNPQLETNSAVNIWRSYEHRLFMRRRCYIKKIH